jgi:cytoplasmic iron level regulating protein YaaA (DUF328/UPF0246 family)
MNYERYQQWHLPFTAANANPALFTFKGEVFNGLDADTMEFREVLYAQDHLRILSGLYGILKPLDLIQPYRLDVADRLSVKGKTLYQYWKVEITQNLIQTLKESQNPVLVNLASNEYFKIVDTRKFPYPIITPVFKESRGDHYKIVTMYAKKARGLLSRFIISNAIEKSEDIKLFDQEGYYFNERMSSESTYVFTR